MRLPLQQAAPLSRGERRFAAGDGGEECCEEKSAVPISQKGRLGLGGVQGLVQGCELGRFGPGEPGPTAGSLPLGRAPLGVEVREPLAAGFALGFSASEGRTCLTKHIPCSHATVPAVTFKF